MAPESSAESGKKFARDMRRIREMRGYTVDDLHQETKIPIGLLETFEETALFDHSQFNRVYLRSFVRTYANVLGIEPDTALEALEEALSHSYTGSLAAAYLGEGTGGEADESTPSVAEAPPASKGADEEAAQDEKRAREEQRAERERAAEDQRARAEQRAERERAAEDQPPREDKPAVDRGADRPSEKRHRQESRGENLRSPDDERNQTSRRQVTGAGAAGQGSLQPEQSAADDEAWTAQSPPSSKATSRRTESRDQRGGADWRWIGGIAGVVVVAAVVWIVIGLVGNGDPAAEEQLPSVMDTTATVDTTMAQDTTIASRAIMPTLGDTMNVQIVAAHDKVDPIRVTVDDDLRRPYWLDQGDSMTFRPTNRIVLEELLDNIELSIEGAQYPTNRRDELGRIVITRDSLRAYFRANDAE